MQLYACESQKATFILKEKSVLHFDFFGSTHAKVIIKKWIVYVEKLYMPTEENHQHFLYVQSFQILSCMK